MFALLAILQKYAHWVLFIVCEVVAFSLIVTFNQSQKEIFLHSSSLFSGSILKQTAEISDYMNLSQSNEDLLSENARLLRELINTPAPTIEARPDTSVFPYDVIPARVINNTIHSTRNFFTIDKGSKDGIEPSMGVITINGVAGIVKQVSTNYATVLSLLNTSTKISASIDGQNHFGTISWDGRRFDRLSLSGIPKYVQLSRGGQVSTNGYSTIFPKGLPIGTISAFDVSKNGVFYDIAVEPITEFSELGHVYIVKDNFAEERLALELDE